MFEPQLLEDGGLRVSLGESRYTFASALSRAFPPPKASTAPGASQGERLLADIPVRALASTEGEGSSTLMLPPARSSGVSAARDKSAYMDDPEIRGLPEPELRFEISMHESGSWRTRSMVRSQFGVLPLHESTTHDRINNPELQAEVAAAGFEGLALGVYLNSGRQKRHPLEDPRQSLRRVLPKLSHPQDESEGQFRASIEALGGFGGLGFDTPQAKMLRATEGLSLSVSRSETTVDAPFLVTLRSQLGLGGFLGRIKTELRIRISPADGRVEVARGKLAFERGTERNFGSRLEAREFLHGVLVGFVAAHANTLMRFEEPRIPSIG